MTNRKFNKTTTLSVVAQLSLRAVSYAWPVCAGRSTTIGSGCLPKKYDVPANFKCTISVEVEHLDSVGVVASADGLRSCASSARNDRSCEQIAAFIGEKTLRYLEGVVTPIAVQVRLECDNGDTVEWNAVEAELVEVVIDGAGDSSGAVA